MAVYNHSHNAPVVTGRKPGRLEQHLLGASVLAIASLAVLLTLAG